MFAFRRVGSAVMACVFAAVCSPCRAQTAYPMLMSLRPVAIQAGSSAEITVSSRYSLAGAYQTLISGEGVTAEIVPVEPKEGEAAKKPLEKMKIRVAAEAESLPGVRDLRMATPRGVSTVGQLVVVRDPVIAESGNNDMPGQAQAIALPAAVCGAIERAEDVDLFRFAAEAGQTLVFQVRCARLQDRIHDLQTHADPIITLKTLSGGTLVSSDNDSYQADPVLAHRFDQAGEYLLEVRDVRYQGNQYWEYCIEINSRPLVESVFPLAVGPGQSAVLEPYGLLVPEGARANVTVPTSHRTGVDWFRLSLEEQPCGPAALVVSDLPLRMETHDKNDSYDIAEMVAVPTGINGRLAIEGDVDCYAFAAKKGEAFSLEVVARRVRSQVDSQLRILDERGKQLQLNDDLRLGKRSFSDSSIENWTAPADGNYVVEVRDIHQRGGNGFPYFLRITRSEPAFELYIDSDKTQLTSGGSAAIFVRAEKKNGFNGGIELTIDGLPGGVQASCGRILPEKGQDACIILEAAAGTPLAVQNIVITGVAEQALPDGTMKRLAAVAIPYQEIYQPGGGRGHWPVASHALAITEPADILSITLSTHDITLRPGQSEKIEVTIERAPGFTANVTLDMLMRHLNSTYANTLPAGVTLNDKEANSLLAGSATQGHLTLTAAKDAPAASKQQAVVMAHVALNFVMKWTYTSRPVTITVLPPGP